MSATAALLIATSDPDSEISLRQRRSVIDAIANHGNDRSTVLQAFHECRLLDCRKLHQSRSRCADEPRNCCFG